MKRRKKKSNRRFGMAEVRSGLRIDCFCLRNCRRGLCFAGIGFFDTTAFFVSLPFELFMFSSDLKWKEE